MKRLFFAVLALAFCGAASAQAKAPPVGLKGYDPVSYFTPGKAVRGASSIAYDFDDARYLFSTQKNKQLFAANPDKYTPQFSGLCATGMGMDGGKYQADPNVFLVREGKLYVFSSAEARAAAEKDPSLLRKAHEQWQKAKK
jgi:YHS domain-containing protein